MKSEIEKQRSFTERITIVISILSSIMLTPFIFIGIRKYMSSDFKNEVNNPNILEPENLLIFLLSFSLIITILMPIFLLTSKGRRKQNGKTQDDFRYSYIELPKELKTSIQQYLIFFKDYVEVAKKENIDFEIVQIEGGLQIKTSKQDEDSLKNMQEWFDEYISFVKGNMESITINVDSTASEKEIDLLRVKLENQVSNLKNSLKIAELENHYLKGDNQFLKNLALTFSNKDNVINNQYIQGGGQQFASKIDNQRLHK